MLSRQRARTALIVDVDVGLIFWLGDIFGKAGWNTLPALNCRQAASLAVMWDLHMDLIVVNAALSGIPAMVETLSRVHRPKVVIIRDPNVEANVPADGTIDRPDTGTSVSRAEWTKRLRRLLRKIGLALETEPDGRTGI